MKTNTCRHKKPQPHILITAGPTREWIDPVRYMSNCSTGTMGYTLAREALRRGYQVTLISGPTQIAVPKGVMYFSVETAREMFSCVQEHFHEADSIIMTAAVSDYSPVCAQKHKIKKGDAARLTLELRRTPDILKWLGKNKKHRIVTGFSLETDQAEMRARQKLVKKNADIIVSNACLPDKSPFGTSCVGYMLLKQKLPDQKVPACSKSKLAKLLLDNIETLMVC